MELGGEVRAGDIPGEGECGQEEAPEQSADWEGSVGASQGKWHTEDCGLHFGCHGRF